jgi:uncharacterized protein YecE (DUF72 family)
MACAYIGICGWNYRHWSPGFYAGVPARQRLRHCAERFTGLEIDGTFYRRLSPRSVERYLEETPPGFRLTAKGHRMVTHYRRLRGVEESIRIHRETMGPLGKRLALVVWQLPERMTRDVPRLVDFLQALEAGWPGMRFAMEFRHASWFDEEVASLLARHEIANVLSDCPNFPMWEAVTTDIAYARLHGHTRAYASAYGDELLRGWANRVRRWLAEGRDVHVYFDNDAEGHAPYDAMRLLEMLGDAESSALHKRSAETPQ